MFKLILGQWQNHKKKTPVLPTNEADIAGYQQPVNRFNPLYEESDELISITSNGSDKLTPSLNSEVPSHNTLSNGSIPSVNNHDSAIDESPLSPSTALNGVAKDLPKDTSTNHITPLSQSEKVPNPVINKDLQNFSLDDIVPTDNTKENEALELLDSAISQSTTYHEIDSQSTVEVDSQSSTYYELDLRLTANQGTDNANDKSSDIINSSQNNGAISRSILHSEEEENYAAKHLELTSNKNVKLENKQEPRSLNNPVEDTINIPRETIAENLPQSLLNSETKMESTSGSGLVEDRSSVKETSQSNIAKTDNMMSSSYSDGSDTKLFTKKQSEGVTLKKALKVRAKAIEELIKKFQSTDDIGKSTENQIEAKNNKKSGFQSTSLQTVVKQTTVPEPILPPPPPPMPSIPVQPAWLSNRNSAEKGVLNVDTKPKELHSFMEEKLEKIDQSSSSEITKMKNDYQNLGKTTLDDSNSNLEVKIDQTVTENPKVLNTIIKKVASEKKSYLHNTSFETKVTKNDATPNNNLHKFVKKSDNSKPDNIIRQASKAKEKISKENASESSISVSNLKQDVYKDSKLFPNHAEMEPNSATKSDDSTSLNSTKTSSESTNKPTNTKPPSEMSKKESYIKSSMKKSNRLKNGTKDEETKEKSGLQETEKALSENGNAVTKRDQTVSENLTAQNLGEAKDTDIKKRKSSLKVRHEINKTEKNKAYLRDRKRPSKSGQRHQSCRNCKHTIKNDFSGLKKDQCGDYYEKVTRDLPNWYHRRPESWASDMSWDEYIKREYSTPSKISSRPLTRKPGSVRSSYRSSRNTPIAYRDPYYLVHHQDLSRTSDDSSSSYPGQNPDANMLPICQCEECWLSFLRQDFLERASFRCKSPTRDDAICTCGVSHPFLNDRKVKFAQQKDYHDLPKDGGLTRTEELPETDSEVLLNSNSEKSTENDEEPSSDKTGSDLVNDSQTTDLKKNRGSIRKDKKVEIIDDSKQKNGFAKINGLINGTTRLLQPWELEELDRIVRLRLLKKRRRRAQYMAIMSLVLVIFVGLVVGIVMVYLRRKSI